MTHRLSRRKFLRIMGLGATVLRNPELLKDLLDDISKEPVYGSGLIPEEVDRSSLQFIEPSTETLPTSVDYTTWYQTNEHDRGSQGSTPTCVAWATARYNGVQFGISPRTTTRLSPRAIYNMRLYAIKGRCNISDGMYWSRAQRILIEDGGLPWDEFEWNHDFCEQPPLDGRFKATGPPKYMGNVEQAKSWLADKETRGKRGYRGFLLGLPWFGSYFSITKGNPVFPMPEGEKLYDHALVVVGYDDNKKAFKVLNSFGSKWGDDGYAWLPYDLWTRESLLGWGLVYPEMNESLYLVDIKK